MHALWEKFLAQSGESRRVRAAEQIRRDGEIQLIDQTLFEQRSKERGAAFASDRADFVLAVQFVQHLGEIDMLRVAQVERRFFHQSAAIFSRHSHRGKNDDLSRHGGIGLKDFQAIVDLTLVRNDYAQGIRGLAALDSGFAQFFLRQTEPNVVAFDCGVTDQHRIAKRALPKQMQLVFARSEIDRRKIARRNFAIDRHGESGDDKGPLTLASHRRKTLNVQHPTV